jgi:non-heme chloroperoxidase
MKHMIEVDQNTKLYVKEYGTGQPLVFIAGWPFDYRGYEYQFNQLPNYGFRCIGIDMRGFGQSDKPLSNYTYALFAQDIHTVLEKLAIKDATLIGHSMGGAISLHYCAQYGKQFVKKLVLCGAAAPKLGQASDYPYGWTSDRADKLIEQCDKDRAKLVGDFCKQFFYTPDAVSPELLQWFWLAGMQASPYATVECLKLLKNADLRSDMPKIQQPTLILHGKEDKVCSYSLAEVMNKGISNSILIPFERSGHGLFYDEREKFNTSLINFAQQQ